MVVSETPPISSSAIQIYLITTTIILNTMILTMMVVRYDRTEYFTCYGDEHCCGNAWDRHCCDGVIIVIFIIFIVFVIMIYTKVT